MESPIQYTWRGFDHTESQAELVRTHAEKLLQFHPAIERMRVTVERAQHRRHHGDLFEVRLHITIPGEDVQVNHHSDQAHDHEDLRVAVRDAFQAARRQLKSRVNVRRGKVKHHESQPEGEVIRLFHDEGYGFIRDALDQEVYFHENSVQNARFEDLEVGTRVRFAEDPGHEGPHASTVYVL